MRPNSHAHRPPFVGITTSGQGQAAILHSSRPSLNLHPCSPRYHAMALPVDVLLDPRQYVLAIAVDNCQDNNKRTKAENGCNQDDDWFPVVHLLPCHGVGRTRDSQLFSDAVIPLNRCLSRFTPPLVSLPLRIDPRSPSSQVDANLYFTSDPFDEVSLLSEGCFSGQIARVKSHSYKWGSE